MNTSRAWAVALVVAGLTCACSSVDSDWQTATTANTVASYQQFLQQHPTGEHADDAKARLQHLQDEQAWTGALTANTADAYQSYLQSQPNGAHAQEAHDKITELARASAWKTAQSQNTPAALQQFLQQYPTGAESDQARAQLRQLLQYTVDVGSYPSAAAAQQAQTRIEHRYASVVPNLEVVAPSGNDKHRHLRSQPMTHDDAMAACASLKKSHQRCEVVRVAST
jgi:hypothetical protein